MADLQTTLKAIQIMEADELNTVVTAIKDRRDYLRTVELRQFSKGDTVSFEDKFGTPKTGTIISIMKKNIKVKETDSNITWHISPNFLTVVETV
tara:strand:+ start:1089 stop:1370 length:282 start_codon:yes stop_codon:yes gene_type:complete